LLTYFHRFLNLKIFAKWLEYYKTSPKHKFFLVWNFSRRENRETMKYVKQLELFQILFKNGKLGTGRLLGMDVGDRYVGLAVSNHLNEIASPHRYGFTLLLLTVLGNAMMALCLLLVLFISTSV
jgi:hypothetical protein